MFLAVSWCAELSQGHTSRSWDSAAGDMAVLQTALLFIFLLSSKIFHHISSASIWARVFKFCIHAEDNHVYCFIQNQGGENYFCLFLQSVQ